MLFWHPHGSTAGRPKSEFPEPIKGLRAVRRFWLSCRIRHLRRRPSTRRSSNHPDPGQFSTEGGEGRQAAYRSASCNQQPQARIRALLASAGFHRIGTTHALAFSVAHATRYRASAAGEAAAAPDKARASPRPYAAAVASSRTRGRYRRRPPAGYAATTLHQQGRPRAGLFILVMPHRAPCNRFVQFSQGQNRARTCLGTRFDS